MERVAEAMSSIVAFMEPDADGGRPEYQGKFQADIIEQSYARLMDGMRVSYDVIRDRWNDILVNNLYQHDIRVCVDSFKSFREEVEAFDDSFCRNRREKAREIPGLRNHVVSNWLSNNATDEMRQRGLDIADIQLLSGEREKQSFRHIFIPS